MSQLIAILLLILFVLFCLAALGAAWLISRRRPPDPANPPSNYGLSYEEVHFHSRDGTPLVGWWIPSDQADAPAIIVCHGMTGSMDGDTHQVPPLHEAGFNVLMFDFRAHGRSSGDYVTMGMFEKEDLHGAVDFLATQYGITQTGVLGFSMGGATALIAAAQTDAIRAVVADASFGRLKNTLARWLGRRGVPYLIGWQIIAWALAAIGLRVRGRIDQTDPVLWTRHIKCPVLFIHGAADKLVSVREVEQMAERTAGPHETWIVPGAVHRGAYKIDPDAYNRRMIGWFQTHLRTNR